MQARLEPRDHAGVDGRPGGGHHLPEPKCGVSGSVTIIGAQGGGPGLVVRRPRDVRVTAAAGDATQLGQERDLELWIGWGHLEGGCTSSPPSRPRGVLRTLYCPTA
jgi:hypothetical protein